MTRRPPNPEALHPLLGALDDSGVPTGALSPEDAGLSPPPSRPPQPEDVILDDSPQTPSIYCDHCGHVDGHAFDCPEAVSLQAAREERIEQLADEAERRASIRYWVRKIAVSALRRLAQRVAGE